MPRKKGSYSPEERKLIGERNDQANSARAADRLLGTMELSLYQRLEGFLISYGAQLMEIDRNHPLGDPERPAYLEAHRRAGLRTLDTICNTRMKKLETSLAERDRVLVKTLQDQAETAKQLEGTLKKLAAARKKNANRKG